MTCSSKNCPARGTRARRLPASRARCAVIRIVLLLLAFALVVPLRAWTMSADVLPLGLPEVESLALDSEPGRMALSARSQALTQRAVAAGQLPDPKLRLGLANYPVESGGFSTEGMTQAQLGLRQSFPPGRTRSLSTRRLRSMALEVSETADARARDVLTSARQSWLESYYWQTAHDIVAESRPFFSDLVTVTRSLYSVGRKDQPDLLRAELELSRLEDRLLDISKERGRARAELSEWVGAAATRPVSRLLPRWDRLPEIHEMQRQLAVHPRLDAAQARIAVQHTGVDLARQRYKPGWDLDVGYGYREGELPNGDERSDFVSVAVTLDVPLFRKNRQDRVLAAAVSEQAAAEASRDELVRHLAVQLAAEHARWLDLTRRLALYESRILDQATAQAHAALAAYQSDTGDFADVMRAFIDDLNTRLDYVRLQVERAQSWAVLANLGGLES